MIKNQRKAFTDFVRKTYLTYFKVKLDDQDKLRVPHIVYKACVENLRKRANSSLKSLSSRVPAVQKNQKPFLRVLLLFGGPKKGLIITKKTWNYPDLESAS